MIKILCCVAVLFCANYCFAQDSLDVAYVKTQANNWQIIDKNGKVLADSLFEHPSMAILNCNEGMYITEKGGKYGFRSLFNATVIPETYDSISPFKNHKAVLHDLKGWHLLAKKWEVTPITQEVANSYFEAIKEPACKDNYCLVETDMFINCKGPDGKFVLAQSDVFVAPWNDVNSFITDRILKYKVMANKVCSCHKMTSYYGFIDRNNKWVIEPDYEQADIFSCGLAAVGVGFEEIYTYGYIGMNGDWVIKPVYKEAGRFMRIGRQ